MGFLGRERNRLLLSVGAAVVLHLSILVTVEFALPESTPAESSTIRVRLETRIVHPEPPPPESSVIEQPPAEPPAEPQTPPPPPEPQPPPPPPQQQVTLPPEPDAIEPVTPPPPLPAIVETPRSTPSPELPTEPQRSSYTPPPDTRGTAPFHDTVPRESPRASTASPAPPIEPQRYVEPRYPEAARRGSIEGTVVVRFRVNRRGRVEEVELQQSSGSELLDREALRTVQLWRFDRENAGRESVHRIVFRLE